MFAAARPLPTPEPAEIYVQAMKRAGLLAGEKVLRAIPKVYLNIVFEAFKVDCDGFHPTHKTLMLQWQDGKKVIVWPDELAPGKPRFPTPPWRERS
jgi:branched-chain amino acid transport system substrate-binding protein